MASDTTTLNGSVRGAGFMVIANRKQIDRNHGLNNWSVSPVPEELSGPSAFVKAAARVPLTFGGISFLIDLVVPKPRMLQPAKDAGHKDGKVKAVPREARKKGGITSIVRMHNRGGLTDIDEHIRAKARSAGEIKTVIYWLP